jgi:2,3-bisphosphoglycerate-independent phosphoglycerate mutase
MKCITLLLDGASDRSYQELNYKTPLQFANTPNLDKLAQSAQCGLMTPFSEGIQLGTDLAHFLMFNYKVEEYPNRSIIDAIGENIKIEEECLYLRCSFANIISDEGYMINERFVPNLSDEEIKSFIDDLSMMINGYTFKCIHSYDSHGFIVVSGSPLSSQLSDSDPFRNSYVMKVEAFETQDLNVKILAEVVNTYIKKTHEVLKTHEVNTTREVPVNLVLTKWAGTHQSVESFYDRNGMRGILLGQSSLLKGLSDFIGLDYQSYKTFDDAVTEALTIDYDYIHLHTKTPDSAAHKKDPFEKVKALEIIDKSLSRLSDFEGLLIVTSDHSTPCSGETIHSGESVAFMAIGEYIRRDDVLTFDEVSCSLGSVYLKASDFMNYIINATDRGCLYHLRQGKSKKNFLSDRNARLL